MWVVTVRRERKQVLHCVENGSCPPHPPIAKSAIEWGTQKVSARQRTTPLKPNPGLSGPPSFYRTCPTQRTSRRVGHPRTLIFVVRATSDVDLQGRDGGPFKPSFGLSGAVPRLDRVFPLLARAGARSIRTRFQLVPRRPLRDGESCSTASLRGAHTIPASPGCNECSGASLQTAHDCER